MAVDNEILVKISAQIDELRSGMEQAVNTLRNSSSQMKGSLDSTKDSTEAFGESMSAIRHIMQGMIDPIRGVYTGVGELAEAFAVAFIVDKITEFATKISELGADALHTAAMIGESTEEITHFNFAAGAMGLEGDRAAMGLERLERSASAAAGGSKTDAAAFDALKIKVTDLHGKMKTMSELLPEIANRFQETADGPNKTAIAMQVMGRSGAQMIPLLDRGAAGMKEMSDAADAAGVTISGPMAAGMEETAIRIYDFWQSVEGVAITLYEAFKPAIDAVVEGLIGLVQGFNNSIKSGGTLHPVLIAIVAVIDTLVAAVLTVTLDFRAFWDVLEAGAIGLVGSFEVLGRVIEDAFGGHWARAVADASAGMAEVKKMVNHQLADILVAGKQYEEQMKNLFKNLGDTTGGPAGPKPAAKPDLPPLDRGAADQARKLADEKLRAAEEEELAEVKLEQDKDNFLYSSGQISAQKLAQMEEALANKKLEITTRYLQAKAAADAKDPVQHQKDLDEIKQAEQTTALDIQRIHEKLADEERKTAETAFQEQMKGLEFQKSYTEQTLHSITMLHGMSTEEEANDEIKLTQVILAQEIQRIRAMEVGLDQQSNEYKKYEAQIVDLTNKANLQINQLNYQAQQQTVQRWQQVASSITQSFKGALAGMLDGTMTWQRALLTVVNGITNAFLDMGEKMLEDWIAKQIEKQLVTQTSQETTQATQVLSLAEIAAAGAISSWSAAPWPINLSAPAMGAAAFAETMTFAEKGAVLEQDQIVFAHKNEAILPAALSMGLQHLISNGGKTGGGDVNLHYSPTVHAPPGQSFDEQLENHGRTLVSFINARIRDGSLKPPR